MTYRDYLKRFVGVKGVLGYEGFGYKFTLLNYEFEDPDTFLEVHDDFAIFENTTKSGREFYSVPLSLLVIIENRERRK